MKIKFDKKKKKWIELELDSEEEGIYIDRKLFQKLMKVKEIQNKGYDCVIIVDGDRRIGKSIMGMTMGWILSNETLTLNNFAIGCDDAMQKIKSLPDRSILFVDEGGMVFNSKDWAKTELKKLIKVLDVVGQKEMVFIIVLPSFFDLIKNIAVRISRVLIHVYADSNLNRGRFSFYGRKSKKVLYALGKKNYDSYKYPSPKFRGRFTNFKVPFYEDYLKLKKKTLYEVLDNSPKFTLEDQALTLRRDIVKKNMEREDSLSNTKLGIILGVGEQTIRRDIKFIKKNEISKKLKHENNASSSSRPSIV